MMKLSRVTASAGLIQHGLISGVSRSGMSASNATKYNVSVQTGEEFSMLFFQNRVQNLGKRVEYPFVKQPDFDFSLASEALRRRSQPHKTKFLCSFGGKFLPRPGDAKLRYVGGNTRIISICNNITWQELIEKTSGICNEPHRIKYQLPDEDLDALISVCSDEDLQIMFEECNCNGNSCRLRMFLIPTTDSKNTDSNCITVQQYVAAVNSITDCSSTNNCNSQNHPALSDECDSLFPLPPPLVDMSDISKPMDLLSEYDVPYKSHVGIPHLLSDSQVQVPEQGENSAYCSRDLLNGSGQPISILDMDTPLQYLQLYGLKQQSCDANSQTDLVYGLAEETIFKQSTTVDNPNRDSGIRGEVSLIDLDFVGYSSQIFEQLRDEASYNKQKEKDSVNISRAVDSLFLPKSIVPDSNLEDLRNDDEDKEYNDGGEVDIFNDRMIAEWEACLYGPYGLQTIKNAELEELRELGCGSFGTVYHGKWRGTDVAIKKITKSCVTGTPSSQQEQLIKDFWREAQILSNLHHPNVLAFYGVVPDGADGTLATVTELMPNGSLSSVVLKKHDSLDRHKKLTIAVDVAIGMEYLHSKKIVHFDLKCDNLLVNLRDPQRPICKVGDFGLSRIKRHTLISGGIRGTLPWMAPELFNGDSTRVSEKVDVFSFGITLWEILTEEEPYANMHCGEIIGGIVMNTLRPQIPKE